MQTEEATEVERISAEDAKARLARGEPIVFVDSRNPAGQLDVRLGPGPGRGPGRVDQGGRAAGAEERLIGVSAERGRPVPSVK
jgi:hypothetical protein